MAYFEVSNKNNLCCSCWISHFWKLQISCHNAFEQKRRQKYCQFPISFNFRAVWFYLSIQRPNGFIFLVTHTKCSCDAATANWWHIGIGLRALSAAGLIWLELNIDFISAQPNFRKCPVLQSPAVVPIQAANVIISHAEYYQRHRVSRWQYANTVRQFICAVDQRVILN